MPLRLARQARGFSQQQLAGMAGVTRQAVSAVESGRSDPSLRAALALARAMGMSVEELFGPMTPAPTVSARPVAPLGEGDSRVALAPIGDTFVVLPLAGAAATRAGFLPASGLIDSAPAGQSPAPGSRSQGSHASNTGTSLKPAGRCAGRMQGEIRCQPPPMSPETTSPGEPHAPETGSRTVTQMRLQDVLPDASAPVVRACSRICVRVAECQRSGSRRLPASWGSVLTPCAAGRMGDGSRRSLMRPDGSRWTV